MPNGCAETQAGLADRLPPPGVVEADVQSPEQLIVDLKDSLERELVGLRQDVQQGIAQLNMQFHTQAARLERHAGLWQAGARWSSRMGPWAEKVDAALETKDRETAELQERLLRLERKSA